MISNKMKTMNKKDKNKQKITCNKYLSETFLFLQHSKIYISTLLDKAKSNLLNCVKIKKQTYQKALLS